MPIISAPSQDIPRPSDNNIPTVEGELFGGNGDKGNGQSGIAKRRIINKCDEVTNTSNADEEGVVWVSICVDASGRVSEAKAVTKTPRGEITTISSKKLKDLAVTCAQQYRYEPGEGEDCGTIPIYFGQR